MSAATLPRSRSRAVTLRDWHANISAFIAPVVVFYAISGALQIFNLHESHGTYVAPAIIVSMGRLHKNQVIAAPPARAGSGARSEAPPGGPTGGGPPGGGPPGERKTAPTTLALKWLFCIEALGLATTTVLGAWIGLTHAKRKRTIVALLIAGAVIPIVLIVL